MLDAIHTVSQPVGRNMHFGKTKIMFNSCTKPSPVIVEGMTIEKVDSYVYLGKKITWDRALLLEVKRRSVLG